ncbi:MAG: hypothetical protein OXC48_09600 [Endozoicomonadaceae bacterium]|nr:hypothetical protein [Endozoicomonadaceae bacterium]
MMGVKGTNNSSQVPYSRLNDSGIDDNTTRLTKTKWGVRVVNKLLRFFFFWRKNTATSPPPPPLPLNTTHRETDLKTEQQTKHLQTEQQIQQPVKPLKKETYIYTLVDKQKDCQPPLTVRSAAESTTIRTEQSALSTPVITQQADQKTKQTEGVEQTGAAELSHPTEMQTDIAGPIVAEKSVVSVNSLTNPQVEMPVAKTENLPSETTAPKSSAQAVTKRSSSASEIRIPIHDVIDTAYLPADVKAFAQQLPDVPKNRQRHLEEPLMLTLLYLVASSKNAIGLKGEGGGGGALFFMVPHLQVLQQETSSGNYNMSNEQYTYHCNEIFRCLQKAGIKNFDIDKTTSIAINQLFPKNPVFDSPEPIVQLKQAIFMRQMAKQSSGKLRTPVNVRLIERGYNRKKRGNT